MPSKIMDKINGMLNEEKWTRATLNDYAIGNFEDLDDILKTIAEEELQDDVNTLCEEHLQHTKNSIMALYLSGIIALSRNLVDDSQLMTLIGIFSDNHKWGAVEYICRRILDYGENKDALRHLATCLDHQNRLDEMREAWERLIKVDYSEADITRSLAEKKEADGDLENAALYYRKAIHRYVNNNLFGKVRDIWQKLVEQGMDDYEFFFLIEKKVAKSMNIERAVQLLEDLYPAIEEREEWDTAIAVLKRILNYDHRNNWARQMIINCYRFRYAGHSQLEECIRLSNLNQNWRNSLEAIADFEKHISFDAGSFVFHKTWKVGIIKEIIGEEICIDFTQKRNHRMSLKMAVGALQSLAKNHIWVLKSIHSKDKLKAKIKKDISWALKATIRSFDNVADMKRIKAELVPSILTQNEWSSWSTEARKILKDDPSFGNVPDKVDQFVVRDKPMSHEEKAFNQFKAKKNFFAKIQAARVFLEHSDPDSEFFAEMMEYFIGFLKSATVSAPVVGSFLFVQRLSTLYPFLKPDLDWGFKELWTDIEDVSELFSQIEDLELRGVFLTLVRREVEEWPEVFLTLFPIQTSKSILDELLAAGFQNRVKKTLEDIVDHYREYREAFIWLAKEATESDWVSELGISYEKLLITMMYLLNQTFRDIAEKRELSFNRRLNRQIQNFLFKEGRLKEHLLKNDKASAVRVFTLLEDVNDLDPAVKRDLKASVKETFPDIRFYGDRKSSEPQASESSRHFYVTQSSLLAKQEKLKHIVEVEIPQNSKEIGKAIELGDLSENAEYKAGKEKQETLQLQVGKLKEELERARIFQKSDRKKNRVFFGTTILLENLLEEKKETYTLLGPWESDPSSMVISYLSPFGKALSGHKTGEELEFTINDRACKFKILKVDPAPVE